MVEAAPSPLARNTALDGIRGIAALAIMAWHFIPSITTAQPGSLLAYVSKALGLAWIGVDIFFVLSGYLIGGILLRERDSKNYFTTFYGRRGLRIIPLYYSLLLIHAIARPFLPQAWPASALAWQFTGVPSGSFWLFLQNFFMPAADDFGNPLLGVTWSLSLEEQFYLLIPLFLRVINPRLLPWFFLPLICGAPLLRWTLGAGMSAYVLLPCRLDGLLLGVLVAWILADVNRAPRLARARLPLFLTGIALFFLVGVPVLLSGENLHILKLPGGWLLHTWVSVVTASVIFALPILPQGWVLNHFLGGGVLRWCGLRAYGLYLLHPWALHLSFAAWGISTPALNEHFGWVPLLAAAVATFILAAASYRWLEKPCMSLGQRLPY